MATVTYDHATRIYPKSEQPAVDGLTLDIADGEFLVLVGPSGCGKSTSLRMLAGLEEIDSGTVSIGDRDVTFLPPKSRDVAMVFQSYALYPHMSVADNIGFALKLAHVPEGGDQEPRRRGREDARPRGVPRAASRRRSRAASASGWRWAARSSAGRRSSCSTSRSRTSTRSCACRRGRRSPRCSGGSA